MKRNINLKTKCNQKGKKSKSIQNNKETGKRCVPVPIDEKINNPEVIYWDSLSPNLPFNKDTRKKPSKGENNIFMFCLHNSFLFSVYFSLIIHVLQTSGS